MDLLTESMLKLYNNDLLRYLDEIFNRADIFNCQFIQNFFDFNQFIPNPDHCFLMAQSSDTIQMEVIDIFYSSEQNIILCSGGRDIPVISSFSKINSLFSYFEENGFVKIYKINTGAYGEVTLDVVINKKFPCQVSKIIYENSNHYVTLGFFNGTIEIYDFGDHALNKIALLTPHSNRIINIYCDYAKGYIYSAAYNETEMIISEINYQRTLIKLSLSNSSINSLSLLKIDQKIICSDDDGSIWLYQTDKDDISQLKLLQAIHGQLEKISAMDTLESNNLIFIANGFKIGLYEYKENIKNSLVEINQRLLFESSSGVNAICYRQVKGMIVTACDNGTVQFWTNDIKCPEYVLEAHIGKVSCFVLNHNVLITGSYDKTIKIWLLPPNWTSELYRKNKLLNDESVVANYTENLNNIQMLKEVFNSDAFKLAFSEEDDTNNKNNEGNNTIPMMSSEESYSKDDEINKETEDRDSLDGWDELFPKSLNNKLKN